MSRFQGKTGIVTLTSAMLLMGCEALSPGKPTLDGELDVIEATQQTDIMLTLAEPGEAVSIPDAEAQLDAIPPTVETYKRYLLEAIVADNNKEWDKADSYYQTARGLTTKPAPVLNNWGMSKLARGDYENASNYFQV